MLEIGISSSGRTEHPGDKDVRKHAATSKLYTYLVKRLELVPGRTLAIGTLLTSRSIELIIDNGGVSYFLIEV